jgi:hypothetical protein
MFAAEIRLNRVSRMLQDLMLGEFKQCAGTGLCKVEVQTSAMWD